LALVGVVATEPDISADQAWQLDQRISHVRKLLDPSRYCFKTSKELNSAYNKLVRQKTDVVIETCTEFRCDLNYANLPAYNDYKKACSAENGAFATYKAALSCSNGGAAVFKKEPLCLVSKKVNKNCGPKQLEDDLESFYDEDEGCTSTVTNTGYIDYSGTKRVKKPVKRPVRELTQKQGLKWV
jgi:hypothetical protein